MGSVEYLGGPRVPLISTIVHEVKNRSNTGEYNFPHRKTKIKIGFSIRFAVLPYYYVISIIFFINSSIYNTRYF
jgi:hypothetical protein